MYGKLVERTRGASNPLALRSNAYQRCLYVKIVL
jgi:hypothetical protein